MSKSFKVTIKRELYEWAIDESGKSFDEVKETFNKIDKWIIGEDSPTFKQLEKLGNFLKVPYGLLLLKEPPPNELNNEKFRTIRNKIPHLSKNLKDTLKNMNTKVDWLSDYRKENGYGIIKLLNIFKSKKTLSISEYVAFLKKQMDIGEYWYKECNSNDDAFKYLRDKIENAGIIVMQSGIVGSHTKAPLDIHEFRAFMIFDEFAPLIFINAKDSAAGKIFSLIHELFHILFEMPDIVTGYNNSGEETRINKLTSEFLFPKEHILANWQNNNDSDEEKIQELSKLFKVSEYALSIKLYELGFIDSSTLEKIKNKSLKFFEERLQNKSSGGNYANTIKSRVSVSFREEVIAAVEKRELSYTEAFRLLDGSENAFNIFSEKGAAL